MVKYYKRGAPASSRRPWDRRTPHKRTSSSFRAAQRWARTYCVRRPSTKHNFFVLEDCMKTNEIQSEAMPCIWWWIAPQTESAQDIKSIISMRHEQRNVPKALQQRSGSRQVSLAWHWGRSGLPSYWREKTQGLLCQEWPHHASEPHLELEWRWLHIPPGLCRFASPTDPAVTELHHLTNSEPGDPHWG